MSTMGLVRLRAFPAAATARGPWSLCRLLSSNNSGDKANGGKKDNEEKATIGEELPPRRQSAIPERFLDAKTRRPEGLLRGGLAKQPDEDVWMTPEVLASFERNFLLKDLQLKPGDQEHDFDYLTNRRRQGGTIEADQYDSLTHAADRNRPHDIQARLDRSPRTKCNKKRRFHILPQDQITIANLPLLREFLSENGTILRKTHSGLCSRCQRRVRNVIKRARNLGFIPHDAGFEAVNLLGFPDAELKAKISKTI